MNQQTETLKVEGFTFTQVPDELITDTSISIHARMIYIDIAKYAYKGKEIAFPGIRRIAEDLGISKTTVNDNLKKLYGKWLSVEHKVFKGNHHNVYTLLSKPHEIFDSVPANGTPRTRRTDTGVPGNGTEEQQGKNNQEEQQTTPPRVARAFGAYCNVASSFDAPGGEREEVAKEEKPGDTVALILSTMKEMLGIKDTEYAKQIAVSVIHKVEDPEMYLDYINYRVAEKERKNPAGTFLTAIRDDWFLDDYENGTGPSWESTKETVRNKCPVCELHRKETYMVGGMCGTCGYSPGHSPQDEAKNRRSSEELWQGQPLASVTG